MIVLGIESSCDETGVALYCQKQGILAHQLHCQIDLHKQYGGVVPELASRDHLNKLIPLIEACLADAKLNKSAIDAIAYTAGPGLLGALLCGASVAESFALSLGIPSIKIHHMEGHLLAPLLDRTQQKPQFPFLALLVSGGHTLMILVKAIGEYEILGTTLDDAIGEAFDKTAKLMGISYPGGAQLALLAEKGNPNAYKLSRPMTNRPGLDFSFSGLKTQVRLLLEESNPLQYADIAASFQNAIIDTLLIKCRRAIKETQVKSLIISGGVGANKALRQALTHFCHKRQISFHCPPIELCTDNGLMIAYAGALRLAEGKKDYQIHCQPRWDLDTLTAVHTL